MARIIKAGSTSSIDLTVFFDVKLSDFVTPALNEQGGQPQVNINGTGWQLSYIGTLLSMSNGRYKATLDPFVFLNTGTVIETLYQGTITAASPGDTFAVVDPTTGLIAQSALYDAYGTTAEGDFYFSRRLRSQAWSTANHNDKLAALLEATRLIDRLNFAGDKADNNQVLQFPRSYTVTMLVNNILTGITTVDPNGIPFDVKYATFEIAIQLLDGLDIEMEIANIFATNKGYSTIRSSYDPTHIPEYMRNGIPSSVAWEYLTPYLRDPRELRVTRV